MKKKVYRERYNKIIQAVEKVLVKEEEKPKKKTTKKKSEK